MREDGERMGGVNLEWRVNLALGHLAQIAGDLSRYKHDGNNLTTQQVNILDNVLEQLQALLPTDEERARYPQE